MSRLHRIGLLGLCSFFVTVAPAIGQQYCPWSAPVNLGPVVNSSAADFWPFISKDGRSLYFSSYRTPRVGGSDIWVSQWNSTTTSWDPPQNLGPAFNTDADDFASALSPDGHVMFFASTRPGGVGGNDIYFSRRHNKRYDLGDLGWQTAANLGNVVNTEFNEANPEMFEDDATGVITLYFDSNRPDGPGPSTDDAAHNGNDIYSSILQPDGTFGPAIPVAELNTTSIDRTVTIRRDGLEIFFGSDRTGGSGLLDLWTSTRASTSDPWAPPINLGPTVNSDRRDVGPALSFDGTTLYFQSDRPGGLGILDLYVITRQKMRGTDGCGSQ